jgi:hypothetical protein
MTVRDSSLQGWREKEVIDARFEKMSLRLIDETFL